MNFWRNDKVVGLGLGILLVLVMIPCTALAVPQEINYQGYLTDAGGNPLNDRVEMTFRMYNAPSGGSLLWWEGPSAVTVTEGVFNVVLGSSSPIDAGILDGDCYLGITVGTDSEMSPRMKLTSGAYSIRAGYAESVANASVSTSALVDTAVTEAKIAGGAVTSEKLASASVTSDKVASGTLTAAHLQDGAVIAEILDDDGPGSGLDADFLDGYDATAFSLSDHNHDGAYVNVTGDSMSGSSGGAVLSVTNTGIGNGVYSSASNIGVQGHATDTGNMTNYGGYFEASGVFGRGVGGIASGASGIGVYGDASLVGDVENYGGVFTANGTSGRGVSAFASGSYGRGVYGHAYGSTGAGVVGTADHTGDVANYGGIFRASGSYGRGVVGSADNTGDVYNYGGYFEASGGHGTGVYGYGHGTSGRGIEGHALGSSGIGVYGSAGSYDFYAGGPGTNYGPFTGGHEVKLSEDFPEDIKPGMIVSVTGQTQIRGQQNGTASLSSTLPTIKLSSRAADKAVFGVFVAETPLPQDHWYKAQERERFATVNALGEGRVWVSNINGDIEVGDYITTSSVPGYGQRQDDDLLHSYTLGKAIEAVDWPSVTETVLSNGQEIKVYLIAVAYTAG